MEPCSLVHIKRNGSEGISYPLIKDSSLILGRDADCDFRVQVPSVSDRHAKIIVSSSGKATIDSLVATNPVLLNDVPVKKATVIKNGALLTLGTCSFKFAYNIDLPPSPLSEANSETPQGPKQHRRSIRANSTPSKTKSVPGTPKTPVSASTSATPKASSSIKGTPKNAQKSTDGKENSLSTSARKSGAFTPQQPTPKAEKGGSVTPKASSRKSTSSVTVSETTPYSTPTGKSPKSASRKKTPKTTAAENTSKTPLEKSATPKGPSGRKPKVPTPIPSREGSFRSSYSSNTSRKSTLDSIQEMNETPSPSSPKMAYAKLFGSVSVGRTAGSAKTSRKSVTFGPMLSPEYFDKFLPPRTPVKAGSTPTGLRRSLPSGSIEATIEEEEDSEIDEESNSSSSEEEEESGYSMTGFEDSFVTNSGEEYSYAEEDFPGEASEDDVPEEEEPVKTPVETKKKKLATPIRHQIESRPLLRSRGQRRCALSSALKRQIHGTSRSNLRKTRRTMPTPLRASIKEKPALRKTKRSMPTPVRKAIEGKPSLLKTKKSLPTPLRKAIEKKPALLKTKKSLPTPLRKAIEKKPALLKTKKSLPTPLRKAIEKKPALLKTKKSMPEHIRKDIEDGVVLRKTKRSLPTPLRKDVEQKRPLRKTKKSMPTPLRKEIEGKVSLQKTKKSLATPVRKEIEKKPTLRKTKRSMPTPLKKEIEEGVTLQKTKRSLPTPLRIDVEKKPTLRKTKQSMPTPLRKAIEEGVVLEKTKKSLPTPLRKDITRGSKLRKVRKYMLTPVRKEIQKGVILRKTKRTMATPLRKAIQAKPALRKTKQSMPTPLRKEIEKGVALQKTMKSLPTPLKEDIAKKHELRKLKKSMQTPLRKQIEEGINLRKTMPSLPTPLRQDIQAKKSLRKTKRSMPTPLKEEIQKGVVLQKTKKSLPTPLRKDIQAKHTLKKTKKSPAVELRVASKTKKRLIQDIIETGETPINLPPAKRRRFMENTPISSPNLSGMKDMFATPKPAHDPLVVFEPRLFENNLGKIHFASPVAFTAKKPENPTKKSPMSSRLRNKGKPLTLDLDSGVSSQKKSLKLKKGATSVAAIRRSTRATRATANQPAISSIVVPVEAKRKPGRPAKAAASKTNSTEVISNSDTTSASPVQKKSTRKTATVAALEEKTVEVPTERRTRRGAKTTAEKPPESAVTPAELPKRRQRKLQKAAPKESGSASGIQKLDVESSADNSSQRRTRSSKTSEANSNSDDITLAPSQKKPRKNARKIAAEETPQAVSVAIPESADNSSAGLPQKKTRKVAKREVSEKEHVDEPSNDKPKSRGRSRKIAGETEGSVSTTRMGTRRNLRNADTVEEPLPRASPPKVRGRKRQRDRVQEEEVATREESDAHLDREEPSKRPKLEEKPNSTAVKSRKAKAPPRSAATSRPKRGQTVSNFNPPVDTEEKEVASKATRSSGRAAGPKKEADIAPPPVLRRSNRASRKV